MRAGSWNNVPGSDYNRLDVFGVHFRTNELMYCSGLLRHTDSFGSEALSAMTLDCFRQLCEYFLNQKSYAFICALDILTHMATHMARINRRTNWDSRV